MNKYIKYILYIEASICLLLYLVIIQIGYYIYLLNPSGFYICDAKIVSSEPYEIKTGRGWNSNTTIFETANVRYTIDGEIFHADVPKAYYEKQWDMIKVAVGKRNHHKCYRCEFLILEPTVCVFVISSAIILLVGIVVWLIKRKKELKQGSILTISKGV